MDLTATGLLPSRPAIRIITIRVHINVWPSQPISFAGWWRLDLLRLADPGSGDLLGLHLSQIEEVCERDQTMPARHHLQVRERVGNEAGSFQRPSITLAKLRLRMIATLMVRRHQTHRKGMAGIVSLNGIDTPNLNIFTT